MSARAKVFVIDGGGRGDALGRRLSESPLVGRVVCIPGNDAVREWGGLRADIPVTDVEQIVDFAKHEQPDLVVIGSDAALAAGLADALRRVGIQVFGFGQATARIEWDREWMDIRLRGGVPMPERAAFGPDELAYAVDYVTARDGRVVIKDNGLAAGKGVIVCEDLPTALEALGDMLVERRCKVVIEELLVGRELSLHVLVDRYGAHRLCPSLVDYKRRYDGDLGPNTGSMGGYGPAPWVTEAMMDELNRDVVLPTINALPWHEDKMIAGCLFFGIMWTADGPRVLEVNSRFGDSETQILMNLLDPSIDLYALLYACTTEGIDAFGDGVELKWLDQSVVCINVVAEGYPGEYQTGMPIHGAHTVAKMTGVRIYYAGVARSGGTVSSRYAATGGRILNVVACGPDLETACQRAYAAARALRIEGTAMRSDIAANA